MTGRRVVKKDCDAANLQAIRAAVQTPTCNSQSIPVFTHSFSGDAALSEAEVYHRGTESPVCLRQRRITINRKCAACANKGN